MTHPARDAEGGFTFRLDSLVQARRMREAIQEAIIVLDRVREASGEECPQWWLRRLEVKLSGIEGIGPSRLGHG